MKIISKESALAVLGLLVIVLFILIGLMYRHQNNTNQSYDQQLKTMQENLASAGSGLSYQPVTVSPADKKIYFPQINLSIPLTTLGTSLMYSPDTAYVSGSNELPNGPYNEASISAFGTAGAPQSQSQFDCSELVRIKFEAKPNPYNPNESPAASVNLANGKTLQVYANHLKNCQKEWTMTQANPDAIADLFKQAQSY